MKALITKKLGMTSSIADDGIVQAVTLLGVEPNVVGQIKTVDTDGYTAVQLATGKAKHIAKPQAGHFKKAKVEPKHIKEYRTDEITEDITVGAKLDENSFAVGDVVSVTATSKGKGWAGTIKRHNFKRGRKTHGGRSYRRPGSIGSMYPQRIFPGKKMAGQMGHDQVTVRNLKIVLVNPDLHVIGVSGAVPGPNKGIVIIKAKG